MSATHLVRCSPKHHNMVAKTSRHRSQNHQRCSSPTVDDLANSGWSASMMHPKVKPESSPTKMTGPVIPTPRKSPHSSPGSGALIRCDICDFSTSRIENMVRHQKQHSEEKRMAEKAASVEQESVVSSCRRLFPTVSSSSSLTSETPDNKRVRQKRMAAEMADIRNKVLVDDSNDTTFLNGLKQAAAATKKVRKNSTGSHSDIKDTNSRNLVEPKARRGRKSCKCGGNNESSKSTKKRQTKLKQAKKKDKRQTKRDLPSLDDDADDVFGISSRSQSPSSQQSPACSTNGLSHPAGTNGLHKIRLKLGINGHTPLPPESSVENPGQSDSTTASGLGHQHLDSVTSDDLVHDSDITSCDVTSGTSADWSCDSSCEDDLPDVLTPSQQDKIEVGDLLWVRVNRYPYWPAVVSRVYYKKEILKRLSVGFISRLKQECHKYSLNYNKKNVVKFGGSHDIHENLLKEAHKTKYGYTIQEATEYVEEYLIQRANGQVTASPLEFFGFKPQDGEAEEDSVSVTSSLDTEPLEATFTAASLAVEENREDEDEDTLCGSRAEEEEQEEDEISDRLKACVERRRQKAAQIIEECRGDKMRAYLRSIVDGTSSSRRHKLFHKMNRTKQETQELENATFGIIDDSDQQQDLIDAIMDHYHNLNLQNNSFSVSLTKYVHQVLFPEAVIRAIQISQRRTRTAAEELYTRGTLVTREENRAYERQMMSVGLTDEERAQCDRRIARIREKLGQAV